MNPANPGTVGSESFHKLVLIAITGLSTDSGEDAN